MLTFMFWNINGKPLQRAIGNLVRQHKVDLLILAESSLADETILYELNRGSFAESGAHFQTAVSDELCERIKIYPRFRTDYLKKESAGSYYSAMSLRMPRRNHLLLFSMHYASKRHRSERSQAQGMPGFGSTIRDVERRLGHSRTVLIGDLNMNPFEDGMVSAEGLNAVMTREIASRQTRIIDRLSYPYFYNPMWSKFGDSNHDLCPPGHPEHEPAGTCYYRSSESRWFFWNMFDQVLIRPSLIPNFRYDSLRILVTDGTTEFVTKSGIPDRRMVSDHLPIKFSLDI